MSPVPTLTRAKPLPVYVQIAELLARQIRAGHWRAGERLPTEADLAGSMDVAVGTLRKALAVLEADGVLERIQGSGTYVRGGLQVGATNGPRSGSSIYEFFRLELKDALGLPTAQILSVDRLERPVDVPTLGPSAHPSAWRVRRLRFLDATPVALEEIWFDARRVRNLKATHLGDSMYLYYKTVCNLWISRVEDRIYAATTPTWSVPEFTVPAGQLAGFIERTSWTATNELAEFSKTWFDPQICRYSSRSAS